MKLILPHRTIDLDMTASLSDRINYVNETLLEELEFQDLSMTVEEYFRLTFDKPNTKVCLDILGYYLTKENRNLEILSNDKQKEMARGSKRHTTFTGMGYNNQVLYGVVDVEDDFN